MMSKRRIVCCVLSALGGLYSLYAVLWFGWLSAAGAPAEQEVYSARYELYLGLTALCYVLYIVALRPNNLWLFLLNTLALSVLGLSLVALTPPRAEESVACFIGAAFVSGAWLCCRAIRYCIRRLN